MHNTSLEPKLTLDSVTYAKCFAAIHPKLSDFVFALLKLLLCDEIPYGQLESINNVPDLFNMLSNFYEKPKAAILLHKHFRLLEAEAALKCFEEVCIVIDSENHPTPDELCRFFECIVRTLVTIGEDCSELLMYHLANEYLDGMHSNRAKELGIFGVFSTLYHRKKMIPSQDMSVLIEAIKHVCHDHSSLEHVREYMYWNGIGDQFERLLDADSLLIHPLPLDAQKVESDAPRSAYWGRPQDVTQQSTIKLTDELNLFCKSPLGEGAFGEVFKGEYRNNMCAIKILHSLSIEIQTQAPSCPHEDKMRSHQHECELLESFRHPNIVAHVHTTRHPRSNHLILVLELMDCNLKDFIYSFRESDINFNDKVTICLGIASGLGYIHEQNVVHRDLCTVNVLIKRTCPPLAKISDFGLSKIIDDEFLTTQTTLKGRASYRPPEATTSDHPKYNWSVDIFSFGVIITQIASNVPDLKTVSDRDRMVAKLPKENPLKSIAKECLKTNSKKRPRATKVQYKLRKVIEDGPEQRTRETSHAAQFLCLGVLIVSFLISYVFSMTLSSQSKTTLLPSKDCQSNRHPVESPYDLPNELSMIGDWEGLCLNLEVSIGVMDELYHSGAVVSSKRTRCLQVYYDSGEAVWEEVVEALCSLSYPKKVDAKYIAEKYGVDYSCISACAKS